jgi:hypothetical protein
MENYMDKILYNKDDIPSRFQFTVVVFKETIKVYCQ